MSKEKIFYGWIMVGALWIIYLINMGFAYYGAGVINPVMAKSLSLDRSTLGLGFMLIALSAGLPGPLIALFLNKKGLRFTIIAGSLVVVFGALLMALWVKTGFQYVLIFGVVIGLGVGFAGAIPVQTGITLWFSKKRALALSLALTAAGIGGFVAAPLLNRIISFAQGNWRAGWFFVSGACILSVLITLFFVKNKPEDMGLVPDGISEDGLDGSGGEQSISPVNRIYRTSNDWEVKDAVRTPTLWLIIASAVVFAWPVGVFVAHGVIHLKDLGHSSSTAAMSLGLLTLCSVGGRLLAGVLGDRFESRYLWSAAMMLSTAGILVVIQATSTLHIYLYAIFLGMGYGMSYLSWVTMVGNYFGANAFASIMGIQAPVVTIFCSLAPYLTGLAYDLQGNYTSAFLITAGISLVGSVLILFAKPPKVTAQVVRLKAEGYRST